MQESELDIWDDRLLNMSTAADWIGFITNGSLLVGVIGTMVVAMFVRKRTDCFISVVLISYLISITMETMYWALIVFVYTDRVVPPRWLLFLEWLQKPIYIFAHWAFSAQYLKTCLVLPRLLNEAKIELD